MECVESEGCGRVRGCGGYIRGIDVCAVECVEGDGCGGRVRGVEGKGCRYVWYGMCGGNRWGACVEGEG